MLFSYGESMFLFITGYSELWSTFMPGGSAIPCVTEYIIVLTIA